MTYIKVDHSKFTYTVDKLDSFVTMMKKNIQNANTEIDILSLNWQGSDFDQFKKGWDKIDNDDSTQMQMIKNLESYGRFLKYASSKYKNAQAKAIDRANRLPKY